MSMLGNRKNKLRKQYDKENFQAVVRCSICTGEQVAGFKNRHTGEITELMLIKNAEDLEKFRTMYDVDEVVKIY